MRVLILGAGISGHTAALVLSRHLGSEHEIVVLSPQKKWNWIPSNIWVGIGDMTAEEVTFELAPVYRKIGVTFYQAKALEIHPEGDASRSQGYVIAESTHESSMGQKMEIEYDYLINATGPKLNFGATPGLGPEGFTHSVCTVDHAVGTAKALDVLTAQMRAGAHKTFLIGTGHGTCTCQGAAFEYIFNLEFELRERGVRDKARLIFITNEAELGDFGVGGLLLEVGGYETPSRVFAESLFAERGVDWICGAHVADISKNQIQYETLDGEKHQLEYDFAMLLPPFRGADLKAFDKSGNDLSEQLFNPGGFMKVDGDYSVKSPEQWKPSDWPKTYQSRYSNVFAVGIAFAPPHQISIPRKTKNGTLIAPAPPRTGMPSAIMGRAVAHSILDMIKTKSKVPSRTASMADLGAACVASAGSHLLEGTAVAMTMYPIVPDFEKFPNGGRSLTHTTGEIGLAGHWIKKLLHYAFIYKAKALPFWWIIPE